MPRPTPVQRAVHARAAARLIKSKKFRSWPFRAANAYFENGPVEQKHFRPAELAKIWGVSAEVIRTIFRTEPGVLKPNENGPKKNGGYVTFRISEEIAKKVHRRLSS